MLWQGCSRSKWTKWNSTSFPLVKKTQIKAVFSALFQTLSYPLPLKLWWVFPVWPQISFAFIRKWVSLRCIFIILSRDQSDTDHHSVFPAALQCFISVLHSSPALVVRHAALYSQWSDAFFFCWAVKELGSENWSTYSCPCEKKQWPEPSQVTASLAGGNTNRWKLKKEK